MFQIELMRFSASSCDRPVAGMVVASPPQLYVRKRHSFIRHPTSNLQAIEYESYNDAPQSCIVA